MSNKKEEGIVSVTIEQLEAEAKRRNVPVYIILDEIERKANSRLN